MKTVVAIALLALSSCASSGESNSSASRYLDAISSMATSCKNFESLNEESPLSSGGLGSQELYEDLTASALSVYDAFGRLLEADSELDSQIAPEVTSGIAEFKAALILFDDLEQVMKAMLFAHDLCDLTISDPKS
jgi:hypothetical protein